MLVIAAIAAAAAMAAPDVEEETRNSKLLPVFQVVRFPNDLCTTATTKGSKNGTCYTAEECSSKGGKSDGTCASGFGVCCTFTLACGGKSSDNNTYIVQTAVTTLTSPCKYTICPVSSDVCRTRFDFVSLTLASQVTGTTAASTASVINGHDVGDCVEDQMVISAPLANGSPVICGSNTGYHMILDTHDMCHDVIFNIGATTTTSRSWDIRVTQYDCGQEDSSGPPGCLQYYTQITNRIQNFGWPTSKTGKAVTSKVTHLSSQRYDICIRRAKGRCTVCYYPNYIPTTAAVGDQGSFGLGLSTTTKATSEIGQDCSLTKAGVLHEGDWLDIPYLVSTSTIAAITLPSITSFGTHRVCGRFFSSATAGTASATACTRHAPFIVGVNFDSDEYHSGTKKTKTTQGEQVIHPGGIIGFQLLYWQVAC